MAGIKNTDSFILRNKAISLAVGAAFFIAAAVLWYVLRPNPPVATEALTTIPTAETQASAPSVAEPTKTKPVTPCDTSKISIPSKLSEGWTWTVKSGLCLGYGHPSDWHQYGLNKSDFGDTLVSPHGEVMWIIFDVSKADGTDAYSMNWRPDDNNPVSTRKEIESLPTTKVRALKVKLLPTLLTPTSPGVESWMMDAFVILPNECLVIVEMTVMAKDMPGEDGLKPLKGSSKGDAEELFMKLLASIKT